MNDEVQTEQVFVYGTLRPPRPDTLAEDSCYYLQIASHVTVVVPARLPGAALYDVGAYPAARPEPGLVQGELLTVASEALAIMDRIEDHPSLFLRERVVVDTESGSAEAWVYWASEGLTVGRRRIASGDWFRRAEV